MYPTLPSGTSSTMLSQYPLFTGNKQGAQFVTNTASNFASIPETAFNSASAPNTFVDFSSKAATQTTQPSKPYKVVFESVTAEKKKLRTTVRLTLTTFNHSGLLKTSTGIMRCDSTSRLHLC